MAKRLSKKSKILIGVLTPVGAIVLAFFILCTVTMGMYSPVFLGRALAHWDSHITDYKIFPERIIPKSGKPYLYEKDIDSLLEASWSLDGKKSGFEKMESGINFRSIDFIKIGSAVLHGGRLNSEEIIGEDWLKSSTLCEFPINNKEYENSFLADKNIGYKYMWYSTLSLRSGNDIIAWGKSDQIMYISSDFNTVILRTGKTDGGVSNWVETLKNLIPKI